MAKYGMIATYCPNIIFIDEYIEYGIVYHGQLEQALAGTQRAVLYGSKIYVRKGNLLLI